MAVRVPKAQCWKVRSRISRECSEPDVVRQETGVGLGERSN